ncbi:MAG: hypothetical protein OEM29_08735 [Thermoplasmata archaeon]|nr:hypothetical protein [Thermoplasmata archaeon]
MTDSGTLHDDVERDFVARMDDWIVELGKAFSLLERTRGDPHEPRASNPDPKVDGAIEAVEKVKKSVEASKANLALVNDVLTVRKTSLELKEVVVRSWPRRALSERLAYISSALFPIGGTPFILTGGTITPAAGLTAIIVWVVATALMIGSLAHIYLDDREKWSYFKREFEVATAKDATNP